MSSKLTKTGALFFLPLIPEEIVEGLDFYVKMSYMKIVICWRDLVKSLLFNWFISRVHELKEL